MGPIGFTATSFKAAISGIGTILKKPKIIFTTLFISALQAALSYLKILMPSSFLVTISSFLTFAQGGMYAGLLGAAGGVMGKGIYAWFMNTLFFSSSKSKIKNEQNEKTERKTKGKFALFLAGIGTALIAYNFLTGNASIENSVIGITALAACARAIKRKNGFLIGLICSFTKGRMSRNMAANVIKGMVLGFLAGVISSLKITGIFCYIAGAIIFILAVILLAGRKRTVAAAALILIMSSGLPAYSSLTPNSDGWMTPWEAYDVIYNEGSSDSYIELTKAIEASPPASMELTLIAMGDSSYFYESDRVKSQNVLAIDGNSDTFSIDSPESWYFKFTSSMNLILEDNGWYVDSITSYSINNSWTNLETEEGVYSDYQRCYFPYFSNLPIEPKEFYIIIPIEFQYGDETKVFSKTELYARIDRVNRTNTIGESPQVYAGSWQLKENKSYFIESSRDSYRTAEKHEFKDEFSGNDPTYGTIATVFGNTIDYKIITDYPPTVKNVLSFTAEFNGLPEQMKAFETLRVTASGSGYYEDEINNEGETYDSVPISVGLLPGLRPDKFRTAETDSDTVVYPLGIDMEEAWFENINGVFQAAAPQGQEEGELLTVELILGSNSAYDATESRHLGTPVIAYIYEWNMKGVIPAGTEGEEDEDTGSDEGWWSGPDTDEEWSDHASEEETMVIGAVSTIAAVVGAGAAAAGSLGIGPGGGYGSYIKRNKDGDLVVRDPVTGEENLYVNNKKQDFIQIL